MDPVRGDLRCELTVLLVVHRNVAPAGTVDAFVGMAGIVHNVWRRDAHAFVDVAQPEGNRLLCADYGDGADDDGANIASSKAQLSRLGYVAGMEYQTLMRR